jgi:succinate-semialdehyde dehydrogenase/glutarate-semialdehyde dehydrogenase
MVLTSMNPASGMVLKKFKEWDINKISKQLTHSSIAFTSWKNTDFSHRSNLLKNTAILLRKNKQKYARIITTEMGKPLVQSETEIEKCACVCEYYARNGKRFLENEKINTGNNISYVRFSPLGPLLAVMPWNFPFWQVFRCATPALMAGNVLLLKHSSNVPQCALALEEIFTTAGFPKNVFRSLLISSNVVKKIIPDPRIAAISVTGSTSTGRNVAKTAGVSLKKVVLELGGSDPFIVLADADPTNAAEQAVQSRMLNTGQSCIAAKRFIVMENIFREFTDSFSEKVQHLRLSNPLLRSTQIGPLARKDILENLDLQVKKSIQKGAVLLTGGEQLEGNPGYYYLPTILVNVKPMMPVYHQETFGPVASLIKVHDEKEAIAVANDTTYGLGASIWTSDIRRAEHLATMIDAGSIFINEIVKSDPRLPFGGIKNSGYGRELSSYGIKEFVNIQTVFMRKP